MSLESQSDKAKLIAQGLGVKIADEYIFSESKSAKITNNRPEFTRMLECLEKGEINSLIVWHGDRLSRNAIDTALLIDLMDRQKLFEIVTPSQTFRNTPIDKFMLSLTCGQAKMENDKKGIDVKRGLEKKAQLGIFPGPAPLGYKNDKYAEKGNKTISIDEEQFKMIRRMVEVMLTGVYTPPKIREMANEEWGYRTPKGKKLGRSTIYRIFTNPFYYGRFEYPLGSGIWIDGTHTPLMNVEEYDKIQILLGREGRPRPKKHIFDFIGMMRCGECGAMITAEHKIKRQKNGNVHDYIYYHCTKRKNPNCTQGSIEQDELEKQIVHTIGTLEIPPEFHSFAMKWFKHEHDKESTSRNAVLGSQQKAYNAAVAKIDSLIDMRANGELAEEEFRAKKEIALKEKARLSEAIGDTDRRVDAWLQVGDEMLTFIEHAQRKFNTGTLETRKRILSTLGSNLIIKDKKLSINLDETLFPMTKCSGDIKAIKERLEPLNTLEKQGQFEQMCSESPLVLPIRDSNPN